MHTKATNYFLLIICLVFGTSLQVIAADSTENPGAAVEQRLAEAAHNDPFADDPFADDTDAIDTDDQQFPDPIQGFNRGMYTFNDKMYYYALKPTAQGLAFVMPEPSRVCLKNFFYNLSMPIRVINCMVQGRAADTGVELWRFIINTTAGIGGLFDPASSFFYLPTYEEDTGLTFGRYGAGPGFYLMIPVLGASSGRDGTGTIFDFAMDPLTYVGIPGLRLVEGIIDVSLKPDEYDEIKAASLDPYVAIRNGYLQNREAKILK